MRPKLSETSNLVLPWLIQRCTVKPGSAGVAGLITSHYVDLDHMGSAEFEFGAIPRFQRAVNEKIEKLIPHKHTHNGVTLHFLCEAIQAEDYCKIVEMMIDKTLQLKERSGITEKQITYVGSGKIKKPQFDHPNAPLKYDVWFDIDNAIPIARNRDVLLNLKMTINNSIRFMDSQKNK